jgi:aspartyl-tRNA synthetase
VTKRVSCGALRVSDVQSTVDVRGWVNRRRDHGGLIFIDVRDRDGITQLTFDPQNAATFAIAETLRPEDVIGVIGVVRARPEGTTNPKLGTGEIEVGVETLDILNRSQTPPFVVANDDDVDESIRLRYRYLDLRRTRMQHNLTVRHKITKAMRDYFDEHEFLEIETPMLIKSTPEGARDYLVPSRIYPGSFYALPQSPQLLKQILMIGGLGRYMQIARCFRDEDPRADRQPEFTQLDVEMTFVEEEDVLQMMEGCVARVWKQALGLEIVQPILRLSHADAMRRFGNDKPDMRFGLELADVAPAFANTEIKFLAPHAASDASRIVAVRYPGGASLSRRDFDELTELAKSFGAGGLIWLSVAADGWKSSIQKLLSDEVVANIQTIAGAETGDALLILADKKDAATNVAGRLRSAIGDRLSLTDPATFAFCWVLNFPLFEQDPETGEIASAHHPFTAPGPGEWDLIDTDKLAMRAQHYDLVLNGYELGSGSIRIHKPEFQRKIFRELGLTDEEIADRFGFFMEALEFGAPPHGGMALGLDRIAMLACGETSIRDVIAFPKNQAARDVMMEAPSSVPPASLRDLGLTIKAAPVAPPLP